MCESTGINCPNEAQPISERPPSSEKLWGNVTWDLPNQVKWAALPETELNKYTGCKFSFVFWAGGDRSAKGQDISWKRNEEPLEKTFILRVKKQKSMG